MLTNIFDTHAHYDDERFNDDRDEVLSSLPSKGVHAVINVACDIKSCVTGMELACNYDFIYASVGVHPHSAAEFTEADTDTLASYTKQPKVVAIGEIGLDYHYDFSPRDVQQQVFERQIRLARDLDLPIIVHDREAHADTMALLQKYRPRGILHCYSGSAEMAKELIKLGMYIAFGGTVTFKNARKTLEAATSVPLERLLVETDCPYMTPEPLRGTRCESSLIAYTAQKLAELHHIEPQELLNITCKNAYQVYQITK